MTTEAIAMDTADRLRAELDATRKWGANWERLSDLHLERAEKAEAVLDVLRELLAVTRQSRDLQQQILAVLGRQRQTRETRAAALLPVLAASVAARAFSAREVMAHSALVDGELRFALATAGISSARQLGTWCRRVEGEIVGGFQLQRLGADRDGIVWRVWRV